MQYEHVGTDTGALCHQEAALRITIGSLIVVLVVGLATAQPSADERTKFTAQSLVESFGSGRGIAGADIRPIGAVGIAMLKHFEGWEPLPYDDPAGYCTVGFGHLLALAACATLSPLPHAEGLSAEAGENLLELDTRYARQGVRRLVEVELDDDQFSALSSFVFNIGLEKFSKSTLLSLLNEGAHDLAAKQLARWVKAGGKVQNGLVARRACEYALFSGHIDSLPEQGFDRTLCDARGIASTTEDLIDVEVGE